MISRTILTSIFFFCVVSVGVGQTDLRRQLAEEYVEKFTESSRIDKVNLFQAGSSNTGFEFAEKTKSTDSFSVKDLLLPTAKERLIEINGFAKDQAAREITLINEVKAEWANIIAQGIPIAERLTNIKPDSSLLTQQFRVLFVCCNILALIVLGVAILHDRRHDIRKRLLGTRARSLKLGSMLKACLLSMAGITFFLSIYTIVLLVTDDSVRTPTGEELRRRISDLDMEIATIADQDKEINIPDLTVAHPFPRLEKETRLNLAKLLVSKRLLYELSEAFNLEVEKLEKSKEELNDNEQEINEGQSKQRLAEFLISVSFLFGYVSIAYVLRKRISTRLQTNSDTCPSCLALGSFQSNSKDSIVRCVNRIPDPDYPEDDKECGFELRSIYRSMPKLCFPTLGHVNAGKTHWLAMAYRELSNSNHDPDLYFARVKGSQTDVFDDLVNDLIEHRQGTGATQVEYVDPLLLHFTDKDRFGETDTLLNMFDYSGEVTLSRTIDDPLRARALDADGYLFFLDPTLPAEPQQKALNQFAEDVKILKGIEAGRTIQVPVAICISKLDLIANESYADPDGGGIIGEFYNEIKRLDANGMDYDLQSVEKFSEMMERYTSTIWPGWNINRAVDKLFDGRFRYFPLTPVGLQAIGETSLEGVTQIPYRVIHPLLWLLEMNGYKVFD